MVISVVVTDNLDQITADEFYTLDDTLGAIGNWGRVRQHSQDPRWEARYVIARAGQRVCAVVPVFLGRGEPWSDQIHSPETWGYPGALQDKSALIGGRLEIRGSLRCVDEPDVIHAVADQLAAMHELRGRELFLGYLDDRQRRIAEAVFGPVEWLIEFEDFAYPEEVVLGSLSELPRSVRQSIRHGERKIAEFGISTIVVPWSDYYGNGCELIAMQNKRKGMTDHPALVRYRMDQWAECEGVSPYVAHARMGDKEGAATFLRYRDELEVYEIGLPEGDGPSRRSLYSCLTFDEPRRLARDNGLRIIRAGLGTAQPKRIRGAVATSRHCGHLFYLGT